VGDARPRVVWMTTAGCGMNETLGAGSRLCTSFAMVPRVSAGFAGLWVRVCYFFTRLSLGTIQRPYPHTPPGPVPPGIYSSLPSLIVHNGYICLLLIYWHIYRPYELDIYKH
jgi:hypothetical protein